MTMVRRGGTTIFEITVAGALLAALVTVSLQALAWTALARRAADRRLAGLQYAANIMERVTLRPWEDLTREKLADLKLSDEANRMLGGGRLEVSVNSADDEPARKQIDVVVWLRESGSDQEIPVRLTAFVYRGNGSPPAAGEEPEP